MRAADGRKGILMAAFGGSYREIDQPSYRSLTPNYWAAHLILISAFAYILFEERFTVGVATGGRGVLQPIDLLIPLMGGLILIGVGKIPGARLLGSRPRGLFWLPYVVLTIAFPVLAVFLNSEPVRTLYTAIRGFAAISFIVFGAWGAFAGGSVRRLARSYAWVAIVVEFLFALIDYLNKTGIYPTAVGEFLMRWNVESEGALGEFTFITWRCVGTYTNPNELGLWSVVAFWISALLLQGMFRFTAIIAALLTLILSQSRGSLFALLATSGIWLVYLALSRDARLKKARDATYFSAICFVLTAGWLGAFLSQSDGVTISDRFSFIERFQRGLTVFIDGTSAEPNAQARVTAWQRALDFYYEHPLGTWSSARLSFHSYIDNEYVKTLVQGSVIYLFALLVVIAFSCRRIVYPGMTPRVTAMLALTAAMNGISAYPFSYPAIGVFWTILGYDLTSEWIRREALAKQVGAYRLAPELVAVQ